MKKLILAVASIMVLTTIIAMKPKTINIPDMSLGELKPPPRVVGNLPPFWTIDASEILDCGYKVWPFFTVIKDLQTD